jgi:1-acyl-sn-glycerol-3-phosphate acyltransferase
MKWLGYLFRPLWKIWFVLCFCVPFLILFPAFYFALRSGRFDLVFRLKRLWGRVISYASGVIPIITYRAPAQKIPRPCIIVSNHTSYLDIIFSPFYIDHTAVYMGKYELLKIPLFRYFFVYLDIPVNRKSVTDAHKALTTAGQLVDQGLSQVIYPEGTISSDGTLKAFKNGAFKLAIEKQVPVLPVVNLNNWHFLQNGGFLKSHGRPGIARIVVGEAISTVGMTEKNIPELKLKVHNFIEQELKNYHGKQNRS